MLLLGICLIMNQAYLLRHFWLKRFSEPTLETWLMVIYALGFLLMSTSSIYIFCLGLAVMTFSQSTFRTVILSCITGLAESNKKGEVSGMINAFTTLGTVIGPLSFGATYSINKHLPFVMSAIASLFAFAILYFGRKISDKTSEDNSSLNILEPVA